MKIVEKFKEKQENLRGSRPVTIAFLGDSVTQGCFECYVGGKSDVETVFDKDNAYHSHVAKILNVLYPKVPVNIINAGISGDNASGGLARIERDVLSYKPDLTVVSFGLNDCNKKNEGLEEYSAALEGIFTILKKHDIEVIFMTPNMMATYVSPFIDSQLLVSAAKNVILLQNEGIVDAYVEEAKKVCERNSVIVCDCYEKWKKMYKSGVKITELLANKINHPDRCVNRIFAYSLVEKMLDIV